MKKFSVILLSMLLLFSVSQAVFAQPNYVGINLGASIPTDKGPDVEITKDDVNFVLGAKVNYNILPKLSINGKAMVDMGLKADPHTYFLTGQFDVRYDILHLLIVKAGLSLGAAVDYSIATDSSVNVGLTAGAYVDVTLFNSLSIYGDVKVLLASFTPWEWLPRVGDDPLTEDVDEGHAQFMGSIGVLYKVAPLVGINAEVGYQSGSVLFTVGAGMMF